MADEFTPEFFDAASVAWRANKKSIGNGSYKYICGYIDPHTNLRCETQSRRYQSTTHNWTHCYKHRHLTASTKPVTLIDQDAKTENISWLSWLLGR